ncbi:MAG: hypothetical protein A2Y71_15655 [Bacteroidetes bacterium RBG_13_42_15]|nr:MAG: hypothetical protein A2Y71_15655 [Bacteroidetes bacterium RBG_13_42_15]
MVRHQDYKTARLNKARMVGASVKKAQGVEHRAKKTAGLQDSKTTRPIIARMVGPSVKKTPGGCF